MKMVFYIIGFTILFSAWSCRSSSTEQLVIHAQDLDLEDNKGFSFKVEIPSSGRYRIEVTTSNSSDSVIWVEDYIDNVDDRTYNITGNIALNNNIGSIDGSPLAQGIHRMRIHGLSEADHLESLRFTMIKKHQPTPHFHTQNMSGEQWEVVWSDEFDYEGMPDTSRWAYNLGNWGWGNNELQYYTEANSENAQVMNGHLYITARKDEKNQWTSARLTTAGRHSFTYGKIEFRAKVPTSRGTWAAGWMLGDDYLDEISWPYCGEIDILECVGFEINDTTGHGINHATCHTRAYYFKQGNQIGSQIEVDSMHTKFHLYSVEWDQNEVRGYLDGVHYYTYDKNADEREWPFNKPQNIILNLAIGGGWGGAQGLDPELSNPQFVIDYVRVYQRVPHSNAE